MDVLFLIPVLVSIVILTSHLLDNVPHLNRREVPWPSFSPHW